MVNSPDEPERRRVEIRGGHERVENAPCKCLSGRKGKRLVQLHVIQVQLVVIEEADVRGKGQINNDRNALARRLCTAADTVLIHKVAEDRVVLASASTLLAILEIGHRAEFLVVVLEANRFDVERSEKDFLVGEDGLIARRNLINIKYCFYIKLKKVKIY
jgi:hypothetical protein